MLNSGCLEICKNMLISANSVGIDPDNFYIACLDNESYNRLKDQYKNAYLYETNCPTEYCDWTFEPGSEFRKVVQNKWKIIQEIYNKNKELCWVDTDIVFRQNPSKYIENSENILFQCDLPGSLLCSGFMVFNSSKKCEELILDAASFENADDQLVVNQLVEKYRKHIVILPMNLFPNGFVYYQKGMKYDAVIVHNNHMVGIETKINNFKKEGLWYV